jgi:hypothetical protein
MITSGAWINKQIIQMMWSLDQQKDRSDDVQPA